MSSLSVALNSSNKANGGTGGGGGGAATTEDRSQPVSVPHSSTQNQTQQPQQPQPINHHHQRLSFGGSTSPQIQHPIHYGTPPNSSTSPSVPPMSRSLGTPYDYLPPKRSGSKSRRFSTTSSSSPKSPKVGSPHTPTHHSTSVNSHGPLNTNSPIALAAAAAVTPDKLANLLLSQGPLAIRHITHHLAMTIPGFADLSLSKQRRLIIAVLDAEDAVNGVTFEKVGWGRWAAFKRGDPVHREIHHQQVQHQHAYAPHTKSKRRESITAESIKPPMSPLLGADNGIAHSQGVWADDVDLADDDMMFHNSTTEPNPVFDDDDDEEELDDDDDYEDDEDGLKRPNGRNHHRQSETDEEDWQSIGAASLRKESPASYGLSNAPYSHTRGVQITKEREKEAIDALVQLASI